MAEGFEGNHVQDGRGVGIKGVGASGGGLEGTGPARSTAVRMWCAGAVVDRVGGAE
jgi:hypothetical protein